MKSFILPARGSRVQPTRPRASRSIHAACLTLGLLASDTAALAQPVDPLPPRVLVEPVIDRSMAEGQTFVGAVKPTRRSTVGSAASGRIEEFLINEGDRVEKGQPIARLRIGIMEAELAHAQAMLEVRQAEFEELKNGVRPEEMEQAKARVEEAQALLEWREANRERTLSLGESATRRQRDEDLSLARQADAALRDAQATLRMYELGARKEKLAQAAAQTAAQQAEVERLSEQLARHTMFAPFDGYVSAEFTEIGQWVMQGDPVAEILEVDEVDVEIPVLETFVSHLERGESARVEVQALPNRVFTGRVELIVPEADERARTFPVKVRVKNESLEDAPLLKVGMFARVTLAVGRPIDALLVSKDAVVLGGPTPMLFLAEPQASDPPTFVVRPAAVQLGASDGELIQVIGDIQAGQQVIVEGNERVRPGQTIRAELRVRAPESPAPASGSEGDADGALPPATAGPPSKAPTAGEE